MNLSTENRRERIGAAGLALRLLLLAALLAPMFVLFGISRSHTSEESTFSEQELLGVEYFRTLVPLEIALANAQSATVAGQPLPRENLDRMVRAVAAVDARIGDDLRSHERWGDVRAKIEALPDRRAGNASEILATYAETTDVLLALFGKIRDTSNLILDPEADTYYLHDGATQELPGAIAAVGQLTDLAVIMAGQNAQQRGDAFSDLLTQRIALASSTSDLVDDVRLAVEATGSATLGGNVLGRLDRFRKVADSLLLATATQPGQPVKLDVAALAKARTEAQAAAGDLSQAMLREIDDLIQDRLAELRREGTIALAAGIVGALVAVIGTVLAPAWRRRRSRTAPRDPAPAPPSNGPDAWAVAGADARLAQLSQPPHGAGGTPPVLTGTGTAGPDQWEPYIVSR